MIIPKSELDKNKGLAEKATRGEWFVDRNHVSTNEDIVCDFIESKSDRLHIAAHNPSYMLRLYAMVDELEAHNKELIECNAEDTDHAIKWLSEKVKLEAQLKIAMEALNKAECWYNKSAVNGYVLEKTHNSDTCFKCVAIAALNKGEGEKE